MIDPGTRPLLILLVEDNPGDVFLFQAALEETQLKCKVDVVEDGLDAWSYLAHSVSTTVTKPDLIVLDSNLPGLSGRQILQELRQRPHLVDIPIAIFTSSLFDDKIVEEFPDLCLSFTAKTAEFGRLRDIVEEFVDFAVKCRQG